MRFISSWLLLQKMTRVFVSVSFFFKWGGSTTQFYNAAAVPSVKNNMMDEKDSIGAYHLSPRHSRVKRFASSKADATAAANTNKKMYNSVAFSFHGSFIGLTHALFYTDTPHANERWICASVNICEAKLDRRETRQTCCHHLQKSLMACLRRAPVYKSAGFPSSSSVYRGLPCVHSVSSLWESGKSKFVREVVASSWETFPPHITARLTAGVRRRHVTWKAESFALKVLQMTARGEDDEKMLLK